MDRVAEIVRRDSTPRAICISNVSSISSAPLIRCCSLNSFIRQATTLSDNYLSRNEDQFAIIESDRAGGLMSRAFVHLLIYSLMDPNRLKFIQIHRSSRTRLSLFKIMFCNVITLYRNVAYPSRDITCYLIFRRDVNNVLLASLQSIASRLDVHCNFTVSSCDRSVA